VQHPSEFSVVGVMNMQSFMKEFNKMLISHIDKHHHKTIVSYLIVCDMVKTSSWESIIFKLHIVL